MFGTCIYTMVVCQTSMHIPCWWKLTHSKQLSRNHWYVWPHHYLVLQSRVHEEKSAYFPSHENTVCVLHLTVREIIWIEGLHERSERSKLAPVLSVHLLWSVPLASQEGVTGTDYLSLKEGCEVGVVLSHGGTRREMLDCNVERGGEKCVLLI